MKWEGDIPMPPFEDRLEKMFKLRSDFMDALSKAHPDTHSSESLDLGSKDAQRYLRDISLRGVEEVFEALNELRNSKTHRKTEFPDVDREKFLEEWVDAFNYFFSVLILAGFTPDDLFNSYVEKDKVIRERIKAGY